MRVFQNETLETALLVLALERAHVASPITSIKEITPRPKKHKTGGMGKEKVHASLWDGAGVALKMEHNVITMNDLRELSRVPSHEVVN